MKSSCSGRPARPTCDALLLALDRHEVPEHILIEDGKELTGRYGPAPRPRRPVPWTATTVTMSFDPTVDVAVRPGVDPPRG
jgi:hypothetical protein